MPPSPIIIVGAGVIGLSTAHTLLTTHPSTPILIIAAELPTDPASSYTADYASPWAGAHYRPIAGTTPQLAFEKTLALTTATQMRPLASSHPESGVAPTPALEYVDAPGPAERNLRTGDVYAFPGDNFRVLGPAELPTGAKWGCAYDTYCVNSPVYLRWLLARCQGMGARVVRQRLAGGAREAFAFAERLGVRGVRTVVDCSGRGFHDPKANVIRGQTVLVRQQYGATVTRQCRDGAWSFLIPRPGGGGTIVGGTKEVGDWEAGVREETREALLRRAVEYFPDFVGRVEEFEVVRDNVGRRPWREGGLRIESEDLGDGKRLVHGYGAGGRGYELSWGAAERTVQLVTEGTELKASL